MCTPLVNHSASIELDTYQLWANNTRKHQHIILHPSDETSYFLWAKAVYYYYILLHLPNKITYFLSTKI